MPNHPTKPGETNPDLPQPLNDGSENYKIKTSNGWVVIRPDVRYAVVYVEDGLASLKVESGDDMVRSANILYGNDYGYVLSAQQVSNLIEARRY